MPYGLEINDSNGVTVFNADTHRPLKYIRELTPVSYEFYGSFCNVRYVIPIEYRTNKFLLHMVNGNHLSRGSGGDANGVVIDNLFYNTSKYTQQQLKDALKPALLLSM